MAGDPIPSKRPVMPRMETWWTKYRHVSGMVVETISPHRQKIITPLFRNIPTKLGHHAASVAPAVPFLLGYLALKGWLTEYVPHTLSQCYSLDRGSCSCFALSRRSPVLLGFRVVSMNICSRLLFYYPFILLCFCFARPQEGGQDAPLPLGLSDSPRPQSCFEC